MMNHWFRSFRIEQRGSVGSGRLVRILLPAAIVGYAAVLCALSGCGDDSGSGPSGSTGGSSGASGTWGAGGQAGSGGSAGSGGTAGGGCAAPLAQRVRVTSLNVGSGHSGPRLWLAPLPTGGGSKLAWNDTSGTHIESLNSADQIQTGGVTLSPVNLLDFVAHDDGATLLILRDSRVVLVRIDAAGAVTFEKTLAGDNTHQNEGDRWGGGAGRLAWSGNQYGAYYMVGGNWGAQGVHQGDQLEYLDGSGTAASGGWDWGCSHSLDLRIAYNGNRFGPVCLSDCYPGKGIYFNHQDALISDQPSGNCAGASAAQLGGLATVSDGFWVSWTSSQDRASSDVAIAHITNDAKVSAPVWLTDTASVSEQFSDLARYDSWMLVGWSVRSAPDMTLAVVDSSGGFVEGPVSNAAPSAAGSMVTLANGDVAWPTADNSGIRIVRVSVCP